MIWALALSLATLGGCRTTQKLAGNAVQWLPWVGSEPAVQKTEPVAETTVRTRNLALTLQIDPFPVNLSETRRVEARLRLKNISKRFVQLEFPTTQRFDVTLHDEAGALLGQWSEDQAFDPVSSYVGINPGEQVEYKASLSTRDLLPGHRYVVTAFFPNRDDLKVALTLVPQK